jgi:hypothetical protein
MMPLTSAIKFTAESTFRYEFSAASHLGRYGINSHSSIKAWKQAGGSSALHVSFAQIPPYWAGFIAGLFLLKEASNAKSSNPFFSFCTSSSVCCRA